METAQPVSKVSTRWRKACTFETGCAIFIFLCCVKRSFAYLFIQLTVKKGGNRQIMPSVFLQMVTLWNYYRGANFWGEIYSNHFRMRNSFMGDRCSLPCNHVLWQPSWEGKGKLFFLFLWLSSWSIYIGFTMIFFLLRQ